MGTRFTRVTVVGEGRQIDLSLPADAPLAEHMPIVLRLLSVPSTGSGVRWRLAAPEFGPISPSRSLDEVGVLDGTQLYLTEAAAAPPPPFVDDVESAVAELVADLLPNWSGGARRSSIGHLLAIVLTAGSAFSLTAPAPIGSIAPVLVVVAALVVGALITERGGWSAALVAVPASVAGLLGVVAARPGMFGLPPHGPRSFGFVAGHGSPIRPIDELSEALRWTGAVPALLAVAALALGLVGLARRAPGVIIAGTVIAMTSTGALLCLRAGLPADRTAGLALVIAVILSGLAGQAALGGAGLVDLMVADERGEAVPRASIATAVRRGLAMAAGMVWAAAAIGALACWVMITRTPAPGMPATWTAPAVGVLGGLIFALRSRMFTRAAHVWPMLAAAVVAAAAVALRVPTWTSAGPSPSAVITMAILLGAGLLLGVAGLRTLREVAGARVQRNLERLELVAVLALVPGLVLLFRVLQMVQRWWG